MSASSVRVAAAFDHREPDRTPLFEIFWRYHPIHWPICGRTVATDEAMAWDAKADGIAWEELVELEAKAQFEVCRYFGLDMVRTPWMTSRNYARPEKTGPTSWRLGTTDYVLNDRTKLVEYADPAQSLADSAKATEDDLIRQIESWDGSRRDVPASASRAFERLRELAEAEGLGWVYMGEVGAGTGAAFYPPFQLTWLIEKPELQKGWLEMQKAQAFAVTEWLVAQGCSVIALGGDVSCDKGPFISPVHYREFILPVIREHVALVHRLGARAVYTSDGNHWAIKDDLFFNSGIDGYKEVDYAAGMTMARLIEEGVKDRVCIIGNIDARHTLCQATPDAVREHVRRCIEQGQLTPGGHILHASHSVHEDVRPANYLAAVAAYREFFGLPALL